MTTRYHHWTIDYNPKPTADRRWDYDVVHDAFDGEPGYYCFTAESTREAIKEIKRREEGEV